MALLRTNLFTHRDLMAWLNEPFATPPDPQPLQTMLAFARSWTAPAGGSILKTTHDPSQAPVSSACWAKGYGYLGKQ